VPAHLKFFFPRPWRDHKDELGSVACDMNEVTVKSTLFRHKYNDSALALIVFSFFAAAYFFGVRPAEDAVILYEYSKNLASEGVITYGGSRLPIEGATDFLWMIAISLFSFLHVPEYATALGLSALGAWLLMRELSAKVGTSITLFALFSTPFIYSAVLGFSTMAFCAAFIILLKYYLEDRPRQFFVAALVLCLIRPDGVIWALSPCVAMLRRQESQQTIANIKLAFVYLIVPGVIYFCWRTFYFGEWLPLPFLVKASGTRDFAYFFFRSSAVYVLPIAIPALLIAALSKSKAVSWNIALIVLIPSLFYFSVRLDQNLGNRFLAPMFFGSVYVFAPVSRRSVVLFVAIVALGSLGETAARAFNVLDSKQESVFYVAKQLSAFKGAMSVTESGRLAYYSGWLTHDSWGLNTPKYAKKLITEQDLEGENNDLIVAHCDIEMLATAHYGDGSRSWHNLCVVLTNYIRTSGYTVYLVPYRRGEEPLNIVRAMLGRPLVPCTREFIYAINPRSALYSKLRDMLEANGGIRFSANVRSRADEICAN
jgi:hypothetical protein